MRESELPRTRDELKALIREVVLDVLAEAVSPSSEVLAALSETAVYEVLYALESKLRVAGPSTEAQMWRWFSTRRRRSLKRARDIGVLHGRLIRDPDGRYRAATEGT